MKSQLKLFPQLVLGAGLMAVLLSSCAPATPASPAVTAFLQSHPKLGTATAVEDAKEWKGGRRQRVISSTNQRLVFFLTKDQDTKKEIVQAVYDESGSKRVLVWSASPDTSDTDQVEAPPTEIG